MSFQKYRILWIGCGLSLSLTVASAILLAGKISSNRAAESDLKNSTQRIATLEKARIYPNSQNLEDTRSKLLKLSTALSNAVDRLRNGQAENGNNSGEFAPMVESVVRQLKKSADASGVVLPLDFGFGFDPYLKKGLKPESNTLSRLSVQLRLTAAICEILYAAKVSNVTAVTRDEFEFNEVRNSPGSTGASSILANRGEMSASHKTSHEVPSPVSSDLYSVERFMVEFNGRENSVWEILNKLAKGPPYAVVRDAQIEADLPGFGAATSKGASSTMEALAGGGVHGRLGGAAPPLVGTNSSHMVSREDRVVAGRESVKVSLVIDVYQFIGISGNAR